jgi:hypothetical protein
VSKIPQTLVVNFNSPELNELAAALHDRGALAALVRPYLNKGRAWERALAGLPAAGRWYAGSFGRRRLAHAGLVQNTEEAGIWPDLLAASIGRLPVFELATRQRWQAGLYKRVREAVADAAARRTHGLGCVVAYEGFALPAFEALRAAGGGLAVLSYPVAHHRWRRRVRLEENAREPAFASTWPDFDDWPTGHEQRLDDEIAQADAVLLGSAYARDTFVAEGVPADKLVVVPYGVDLATFRPGPRGPRASGFEAIFSGQLTQRKGLSHLLRGWESFASGRPAGEVALTLVGNPVGDATAFARWSGSFQHVPHLTRPALAERLRNADAFVFPTLLEGMPLVVLEAMACGLPVVATANGPADLVRDGVDGFIIPERDPGAIADALARLQRDPERRAAMGRNAAERARAFSWQAYAGRVMDTLAARAALQRRD